LETSLTMSAGYRLFTLLGFTYTSMMRARKKELESSGISITRAWALWGLKAMQRPATVIEMKRILGRNHQTTSQLLQRMEKEGLLRRRRDPKKRLITVALTAKGEEALSRTYIRHEVIDEIASCLSPDEQNALIGYLERLQERALAKSAAYVPLPAPFASKTGIAD
jgi:DNA-binding MarR family transcriptional regulator